MKLQHTPGPWVMDYHGTIGHIKTLCDPSTHTKTIIKYRYNMCEEILTEEEIQANAHLIAAAPEMLEELITIFKGMNEYDCGGMDDYSTIRLKELIEKATGMSIREVLK